MTERLIDARMYGEIYADSSLMDEMRGRVETIDKRIARADTAIEALKAEIDHHAHGKAEMSRLRDEYTDAIHRLSR